MRLSAEASAQADAQGEAKNAGLEFDEKAELPALDDP